MGSAPFGRRQQAHAALASVLEEHHADRALWHRVMAALGPDEPIAVALEASGHRSQRRAGHAPAASAFARAAQLGEDESSRARRLAAAAARVVRAYPLPIDLVPALTGALFPATFVVVALIDRDELPPIRPAARSARPVKARVGSS